MKIHAKIAINAKIKKHNTLPRGVSSIIKNTEATMKFVTQLVVVDKLFAVPITWSG